MAGPLGHSLAGVLIYQTAGERARIDGRTAAILCVVAAVAPDLDFLPGLWVGMPALYHQGISHSFLFALVVSLALAVGFGRAGRAWPRLWSVLFLAYTSHLVIDLFGPDARPPYGVPLLWPLSDHAFLAPVKLFLGFHHAGRTGASTGEWLRGVLSLRNVAALAVEALWFLPAVYLIARRRSRTVP